MKEEENEFDIYNEGEAAGLLEDDELSAGEEGFMLGYDGDYEE